MLRGDALGDSFRVRRLSGPGELDRPRPRAGTARIHPAGEVKAPRPAG